MIREAGAFEARQQEWLAAQFDGWTDSLTRLKPSEWAEQKRYLPTQVTPMPGPYRFEIAPYLKEILDCLSVDMPVREVTVMKGVQLCITVGILENAIGYAIDHVRTAPVMMVTADAELAKLRMESYITPMMQHSGLLHLIKSSDEVNSRKSGKALEVSTLIPTPNGFRAIGEIHVGDQVYGADGSAVTVDCESDVHERECFELTFTNGETIVASDDHRWVVHTDTARRVLTTAQLAARGVKRNAHDFAFRVPSAGAVAGRDQMLPIKPYTLGVWLGDGASTGANIAVGDKGLAVLDRIHEDGYETKRWTTKRCPVYGINVPGQYGKGTDNFCARLRRLGVLNNKHIPAAYLNAPDADRLELLRGLMDSDGYAAVRGACQITQKNTRLAEEIWSLVNSLGMKATRRDKIARSQRGTEVPVKIVEFFAPRSRSPFTLAYKSVRLKEKLAPKSRRNTIKSIRPVGIRRVKCIGVDHPDHLFLCGRGYIPTHNTDRKIEWEGGGFLVPFGAQNANKLRSLSIEWLLNDEIDGWPASVGKDGDPLQLVRDRTAVYESSRKILNISTPTLKGQSKIAERFAHGDQRRYFVCCLSCNFAQIIRWRGTTQDGVRWGIVWETEDGRLVPDSVRWVCQACQHEHSNDDKSRLLAPENGAEWRATAEPKDPHHRSYHLSALCSPVGMQTWAACVEKWLEGWDDQHNRAKHFGKLQVFYNNVLGETYELRGEKVRLDAVSAHRRSQYRFGEVPNAFALEHCLSRVLLVTCAVDVHADNLAVAVFGWCRDRRALLLNYWRFEGDTSQRDNAGTWQRLRELVESHQYVADDGARYKIQLTLIDSGYRTDQVYAFASEYAAGVFPVKGRDNPVKAATFREFSEFTTPMGTTAYAITVDVYKDRWSSALRREWDGVGIQPGGHFNAPVDVTEQQLKELTVETKVPKPGVEGGYEWRRPSGANNELWDLLVYNSAALDLIAWNVCRGQLELDAVNWPAFFDICAEQQPFFENAAA